MRLFEEVINTYILEEPSGRGLISVTTNYLTLKYPIIHGTTPYKYLCHKCYNLIHQGLLLHLDCHQTRLLKFLMGIWELYQKN